MTSPTDNRDEATPRPSEGSIKHHGEHPNPKCGGCRLQGELRRLQVVGLDYERLREATLLVLQAERVSQRKRPLAMRIAIDALRAALEGRNPE